MRGVDPEIGVVLREVFALAIAPGDGAGGDAGAAAGFHVGGGVSDEEAVSGRTLKVRECEQDVGLGLGRETVGALDVIEVGIRPNCSRTKRVVGVPLVVAVDFRPPSRARASATPG